MIFCGGAKQMDKIFAEKRGCICWFQEMFVREHLEEFPELKEYIA